MIKSQHKIKTVYVGMSGGVDSSVAGALLKRQGFNVVGVFMRPWSPQLETRNSRIETACLWQADREDAMRVATAIGIPLLTWDFSKEYKKLVTDYMIREYKSGRTPNPDVMCNKEIKFGLFLKRALKEGADYIATGHYTRIKREILNTKYEILNKSKIQKKEIYKLYQAKDKNKDQSYFLWTLTQKQLKYCLFPVGDLLKPEVRKLAKKCKLPNAEKKDSQGVCFIGPLDMKEFLLTYIKPKKGPIILLDKKQNPYSPIRANRRIGEFSGAQIGTHDGVYYYTIGQRHGLDIKTSKGPFYVIAKDIKKNIIYVGPDAQVVGNEARIEDFNWLDRPILPARLYIKVRYRTKSVKATLNKKGILRFEKPERAVTSGQSAVFYSGQRMLGGGIIV